MATAVCFLSMIPVRSEPSGKSAMVNQLLFGDRVTLLDTVDDWYKIASLHDNYVGWCESNQLIALTDETGDELPHKLINDITATFENNNKNITLAYGSIVTVKGNDYIINKLPYRLVHGHLSEPLPFNGTNILSEAQKFIGAPYLWGGRSPFGIDCSGLIQITFKMVGMNMPRDAWQQAEYSGDFIDLIDEAQAGDVAFFDNDEGVIKHTGIITAQGTIIHASGQVRVDPIDHQGIFNKELGKYTHKLRLIKRFNSSKS